MKKSVQKYRVGYAIYRRNVPLNNVVYGEKDGRVQYVAEEDETRTEEVCAIAEDNFNEIDELSRKAYKVTYNSQKKFWSATALVPKSFMGRFLGAQGSNKKKIEQSTECEIFVPDRSKKHGPITIKSSIGAEQVERCLDQIETFVSVQRRHARPTHFVSLALQSNELVENYNAFCTMVKNSTAVPDESKQPGLFMPTVRLHLTLCMLALLSDADKEKAKKALDEVVENEVKPMLKGEPLTINVKGLNHFGDEDPAETRVLFAKVSGLQLMDIAKVVVKKMVSIGLAKEEKRELVLHLTLMNSKYVKKTNDRDYTFDANFILRDFSSYEFGSAKVNEVKICALSVETSTGNYQTTHTAPFHP